MRNLVTIEDAREQIHLSADSAGGADDGWLAIFIPAISEAVLTWLKQDWRAYVLEVDSAGNVLVDSSGTPIPVVDTAGEFTTKPVVRAAVLIELASQFRFREGEGENVVPADAGHGYILSKGATSLLAGLRKSTIA